MKPSKAELIPATVADRTGPWRIRSVIVSLSATTPCRASARRHNGPHRAISFEPEPHGIGAHRGPQLAAGRSGDLTHAHR